MPSPGRKPTPKTEKAARGTLQPSRDGVSQAAFAKAAVVEADLRLVPPELTDDVAEVWADYVDAAVAHGARQCDVEAFAEWCTMAAALRKARAAETPAPASYVAQWRMLGELLGLAGPGSRVVSKGVEAAKSNPFARNGRR